jgi:hypothetical protein
VRVSHLLIVVTLASAGSACAKARASTEPVMPVLHAPPPPPRIVERFPDDPVSTIAPSPVENALATPPVRTPARPPAKPEPPKVEPTPGPPRVEAERPTGTPPLTLRPGPGVAAQTEASIRSLLATAQKNLHRVSYASLNADARAQYDTARGFMLQADEELKKNNLAFAGKLADKADKMAAVLVR